MAEPIPCVLGCFGNDPNCPGCHGKGVTMDTGAAPQDANTPPQPVQFIALAIDHNADDIYTLDTYGTLWRAEVSDIVHGNPVWTRVRAPEAAK